jgi:hypothetical protein
VIGTSPRLRLLGVAPRAGLAPDVGGRCLRAR